MLGKRSTDPTPATRFRSDRISSVNGQYFFSTREGTLEGPYFTRFDAGAGNRRVYPQDAPIGGNPRAGFPLKRYRR